MKHKYLIQRETEQNLLIIKEYAELDKDILSLVCEESYEELKLKDAVSESKEAILRIIRTEKLYPPILFAESIAKAIVDLFASETEETAELLFDDIDFIVKDVEKPKPVESDDDEAGEIDDLLEEDFDEAYEDKNEIENINSPLKVAEDEIPDIEDDV